MTRKIALVFILVVNTLFAQISFEKGYFINNTGERIDCLIKNLDWQNNPTEILYKNNENSPEKKLSIHQVQEFSILNSSKFIRAEVAIDRSSDVLHLLTRERNPNFTNELIFLKVLEEGKANLYYYSDNNLTRFFFSKPNKKITQLVYKRYLANVSEIKTNNYYKQQILKNLDSDKISNSKIKWLKYNLKSLKGIFSLYNESTNELNTNQIKNDSKSFSDFFNLNVRPRINNSSLSIANSSIFQGFRSAIFESKTNFGLGIEAELLLPFNKNKWSVIIEANYFEYESLGQKFVNPVSLANEQGKITYKSLEIPVGIRHYMFLNEKLSLFVNLQVVFNNTFDSSSIEFISENDRPTINPLSISFTNNYAIGAGLKHKRFILEFRHYTNKKLKNLTNWDSEFSTNSIILGYALF
ncbi:tRNA modification GTPase [Tenacibaculum jejuense]|uniref:Putative TRNA modification GTPase n=1 Tax=Tenacibaculum jejuense TaxID=584609 RepID=A0A238UEP5_9FLAO|nr:tRNA modification GTPase [Tenacibaculum jejuense]SNR16880.1 putative TRNA modification GTPase [Tenacibaculum jejuense]